MSSTQVDDAGWPQYLIVVRHGESELNRIVKEDRTVQGLVDSEIKLTDLGHRQAQAVGEWLDVKLKELGIELDYCFASPYVRTQETAANILDQLPSDLEITTDDLLREKNFGVILGLSREDQYRLFPLDREQYNQNPFFHRPPGGDSYADVGDRVSEFLEKMQSGYKGKNILVVTHQVPQKLFRKHIDGLSIEETMELTLPNCAVTIYKCDSGAIPKLRHYETIPAVPNMPRE